MKRAVHQYVLLISSIILNIYARVTLFESKESEEGRVISNLMKFILPHRDRNYSVYSEGVLGFHRSQNIIVLLRQFMHVGPSWSERRKSFEEFIIPKTVNSKCYISL